MVLLTFTLCYQLGMFFAINTVGFRPSKASSLDFNAEITIDNFPYGISTL